MLPAGQGCGAVVHLPGLPVLPSARPLHGCEESREIQPSNSEPQGKHKYSSQWLLEALVSQRPRSSEACWFQTLPVPDWLCAWVGQLNLSAPRLPDIYHGPSCLDHITLGADKYKVLSTYHLNRHFQ